MKQLAILMLALLSNVAAAVPLSTVGTFCSTFPSQCQKGTESLMAVRGTGTNAYYVLEANPTTGAIPVDASGSAIVVTDPSVGPTGSAVPADASYSGLNSSGTLIGAIGDSSGRAIVAGGGTAGTPAGGVLSVQGVGSGTALPVSGTVTANQGSPPWTMTGTGTAGTAATGVVTIQGIASMTAVKVDGSGVTQPTNIAQFGGSNVVTGTGTGGSGIPRVTVSSDSTVGLVAGSAIVGKVGIDQTTPGTTNAVSATNFPTTVAVNAGAASSSTLRIINATDSAPGAGRSYADSVRYQYSSGAVGTVSWVQLIASTAAAINCIQLFDSSGQTLELGTGAAASETRVLIIPPGGLDGCVPLKVAASTRIAIRALSATTGAVGEIDLTGLQ